jgi:hypothetical protein
MRTIPYSPAKADLFTPWVRGNYFSGTKASSTASLCAELCRLAYCRKEPSRSFDTDQIRSVLATVGFSHCKFMESTGLASKGTHCFTAVGVDPGSGKKTGVVVFRGTDADDPTDLGDDADLLLKPWKAGGSVHAGFLKALDEVRDALDDAMKSFGLPILFTGHSLGAALATLATSLYKPTSEINALYTIGSPRVGDSVFVTTLDGVNLYRYVDCCDLVTKVPPPEMGYAHAGPARYIDRNGLIHLNPPEAGVEEDRVAAELDYLSRYAWKTGNVGVRDLADHASINYVWAVTTSNDLTG